MSHEVTTYLSVFNLFLTQRIMAILSKICKPDNFEQYNFLKLSFMNIPDICSNFVEKGSFLDSNSPDILVLRWTSLDDSIDSGSVSVKGYLPLMWKDSITHMHSLTSFSSINHLCRYAQFFHSISSDIDAFLSINPFAVFFFGDFNVHYKDWLTYSGGAERPNEICYNFSISNDLTLIANFFTQIPDCDYHSPALLDLFLSSDASICSTKA